MARRLALALCAGAALFVASGSPLAFAGGLPPGFFGVVPQAPLSSSDFDSMRGMHLTVRVPVYWFAVEPRPDEFDFAELDHTVEEATRVGARVLPVVYGTPSWLEPNPARPPLSSTGLRDWRELLARLVDRYGPTGAFWSGSPRKAPIRAWQVWNEPNFPLFWRPRPSPRGYARLLHASAGAIRAADPGATIVAAGVAPVEIGMTPWGFLRRMYAVPGVRADFDVAALHPYAPHLAWVREEIGLVRQAMAAGGDRRKPLQLTELGVASGGVFPNAFDKGPAGQAAFLKGALGLVARNRRRWRIAGVDWFTWQDAVAPDPHCVFCEFAGLFDSNGKPKPAWNAFRGIATGDPRAPQLEP
jgi:polysaccharide biosynthesis protein PslG